MQRGFSLVELLIVLSLTSFLAVSSSIWFISIAKLVRAQQLQIESNEVGRFITSYLTKSFARAGLGLIDESPLEFEGDVIKVRYQSRLSVVGDVRNCLGNKSKTSVIEDHFLIEEYGYGGLELKCISGGLGDWLTEGVYGLSFQVAVDRGRFVDDQFQLGVFDGIPDGYVESQNFVPQSMRAVALKVNLSTYRPLELSTFNVGYWDEEPSRGSVAHDFTTLVLLPNG